MNKLNPIYPSELLENHFSSFRESIIGIKQTFHSAYGEKPLIYTDWTASGRLYGPIEGKMQNDFGPFVANTHTETTVSGTAMTLAYHEAKRIIKKHVNASEDDVLIVGGNGMTGMINKFMRILGLKVPENIRKFTELPEDIRPIVFVSHMEHHSNQTAWYETMAAKVVIVPAKVDGTFCTDNFESTLAQYASHPFKITSITACSNVTGIETPYHDIAKIAHANNSLCFVDFACSAPYVAIDMHPKEKGTHLDAIFFSPHKFLGGPGSSGVLLFNKDLYHNVIPDNPGGGTVQWTNPWGEHKYIDNIEEREDGGTPGFLQTIRTALAIRLKEDMGIPAIMQREHDMVNYIFDSLASLKNLHILAPEHRDRLAVISFYIKDLHYNLGVKLLNDLFGVQTRGGCSCAGTYGHYLLNVDQETSHELTCEISGGDLSRKPGWIRLSLHPTTSSEELALVVAAITEVATNHKKYSADYKYDPKSNEFYHKEEAKTWVSRDEKISGWFEF